MSINIDLFRQYWSGWGEKLNVIVKRRRAKLLFPNLVLDESNDACETHLELSDPICMYRAPQKGSSHKSGASHQLAIFVDGSFTLKEMNGNPRLVKATCSVTLFNIDESGGDPCKLIEIDAVHFDMESADAQTAYHPIFHAQFDRSKTLNCEKIRNVIRRITHTEPQVIRDGAGALHQLRIPTPQMDMFGVLTMVIADFFCSGGDKDPRVQTLFTGLLAHLVDRHNVARDGIAARCLRHRAAEGYPALAYWYAEHGRSTR